MNPLKSIASIFASLKLTVALLLLGMVIIFAGTLAQREQGIWQVVDHYFRHWWTFIPVKNLMPFISVDLFPKWAVMLFPGGKLIIVLMLVNLLAAHAVRFKFVLGDLLLLPLLAGSIWLVYQTQETPTGMWITACTTVGLLGMALTVVFHAKRAGVIIIHFSLIMLLVGELITGAYQDEAQMAIKEGESNNWVQDVRDVELAVIDTSAPDKDRHVVISAQRLEQGGDIEVPGMPIKLKIHQFAWNADLVGPAQAKTKNVLQATAGAGRDLAIIPKARAAGIKADMVDASGIYVTPTVSGKAEGTFLLMVPVFTSDELKALTAPQAIADTPYRLQLRFVRQYKPYSLYLHDVAHDKYVGTEMARNYHSRVTLKDPSRNVEREITIRMNEPLRYNGETFFQSGVPEPDTTVLQVVKNPGWLVPYIACGLGALGMLLHFGIHLVGFLRRRAKVQAALPVTPVTPPLPRKGQSRRPQDGYELPPAPAGGRWVGWAVVVIAIMAVGRYAAQMSYKPAYTPASALDLNALSKIPVSFDGRTMPLDSVARGMAKILSGKEELADDPNASMFVQKKVLAIEWLSDVLAGNRRAQQYKVLRIDHPQVKALLALPEKDKYFSIEQVFEDPRNAGRLEAQRRQVAAKAETARDDYDAAVVALHNHLNSYRRLSSASRTALLAAALENDDIGPQVIAKAAMYGLFIPPGERPKNLVEKFRQDRAQADKDQQNPSAGRDFELLGMLDESLGLYGTQEGRQYNLYFVAPTRADGQWQALNQRVYRAARSQIKKLSDGIPPDNGNAKMMLELLIAFDTSVSKAEKLLRDGDTGPLPPTSDKWQELLLTLARNDEAGANRVIAEYQSMLASQAPESVTAKSGFERFFNRFDPFSIAKFFYLGALALGICSWLGYSKPLLRGAMVFLGAALVVQTFGLFARMYISGRPPVTNLYSSAVFIAWGGAAISLVLEYIYRNGIASVEAGITGFASLMIADALDVRDADTMGQLQAVLDTNFWLATHVVIVTLGYVAAFVAGLIGVVYVILGTATPVLTSQGRKEIARMNYGVVCFAMFASFVGTILGGIWADQSWGRFWGWDPKENGAILIVLWNAIILHARWGGMVKERGLMNLAALGIIVTSWSWFGTNLMGIGLHAYGFIDGGVRALVLTWAGTVAVVVLGLLPLRSWRSVAANP